MEENFLPSYVRVTPSAPPMDDNDLLDYVTLPMDDNDALPSYAEACASRMFKPAPVLSHGYQPAPALSSFCTKS